MVASIVLFFFNWKLANDAGFSKGVEHVLRGRGHPQRIEVSDPASSKVIINAPGIIPTSVTSLILWTYSSIFCGERTGNYHPSESSARLGKVERPRNFLRMSLWIWISNSVNKWSCESSYVKGTCTSNASWMQSASCCKASSGISEGRSPQSGWHCSPGWDGFTKCHATVPLLTPKKSAISCSDIRVIDSASRTIERASGFSPFQMSRGENHPFPSTPQITRAWQGPIMAGRVR